MFEVRYQLSSEPGESLQARLSSLNPSSVVILADLNTEQHCLPLIRKYTDAEAIVVQPGEIHKNLDTCSTIWEAMTELKLDRNSVMINLGGGVIGDMGGFCASTYKRGIRFINIPTTLLSQVDASVGGKLGIDFQGLKNHIGIFRNPDDVIISPQFLQTLPVEELRSGFAEVLKHGLIKDRSHFEEVANTDLSGQNWEPVIRRSIAIKQEVVTADPEEKGLRKILNFGHTLGHAIESYYLDTSHRLLHGEAIAIGMICESFLSRERGLMSANEFDLIRDSLLRFFPVNDRQVGPVGQISKLILQDKKNQGDKILCTLLKEAGEAVYDQEITIEEAIQALEYYNSLSGNR